MLEADAQLLTFARDLASLHRKRRDHLRQLPSAQEPGGELARTVTATALFTDVRGFTRLGEPFRTDPAGVLDILSEHLEEVVQAVMECGRWCNGSVPISSPRTRSEAASGPSRSTAWQSLRPSTCMGRTLHYARSATLADDWRKCPLQSGFELRSGS